MIWYKIDDVGPLLSRERKVRGSDFYPENHYIPAIFCHEDSLLESAGDSFKLKYPLGDFRLLCGPLQLPAIPELNQNGI